MTQVCESNGVEQGHKKMNYKVFSNNTISISIVVKLKVIHNPVFIAHCRRKSPPKTAKKGAATFCLFKNSHWVFLNPPNLTQPSPGFLGHFSNPNKNLG
jgi:hypothetical protein